MKGRRSLFLLLLLAAVLAARANADDRDWTRNPQGETCIGGSRCGRNDYVLRIPLQRSAVDAVRFFAHDDVGRRFRGRLEVAIDGHVLAVIDGKRSGRHYEIDGHGLHGRYLTFRALGDDEVVLSDIRTLYRNRRARDPYDRDRYDRDRYQGDVWRRLPLSGCIGGSRCGHNGYALEARLSGAPLYGIRFRAHDNVGRRFNGRLRVLLDGYVIEPYVDLERRAGFFEIQVDGLRANHLVLEVLTDDEAVVEEVEVLYGGRRW